MVVVCCFLVAVCGTVWFLVFGFELWCFVAYTFLWLVIDGGGGLVLW